MQEETAILAHLEDCCDRALRGNGIVCSRFLDEGMHTLAGERFKRRSGVQVLFYGGYTDAQRVLCFFIPSSFLIEMQEELTAYLHKKQPIALLRVEKDAFSTLSHRDYLGALMGLGLQRDCIGDILTHGDGCELLVLRKVVSFLCAELRQAGKATLSPREVPLADLRLPPAQVQERLITVASLRLDALVAEVFCLSRSAAGQAVKSGLCYVNGRQLLQGDKHLSPGDKLSLRGKGKVLLREICGQSKKGRMRLRLETFI